MFKEILIATRSGIVIGRPNFLAASIANLNPFLSNDASPPIPLLAIHNSFVPFYINYQF
jgi:hypothetical protein